MDELQSSYFKKFRETLGFTNQHKAKQFLAGKDITREIDFVYIDGLNLRIKDIIKTINLAVHPSIRRLDIDEFADDCIFTPYSIMSENDIIPKLNNQGRNPESVLFSWLRGFVIAEYFRPALSKIFDVQIDSITNIGDDDFRRLDTFKRSPKADLQIEKNGKKIRIEVQSGFQNIHDIKEHKVREAKRAKEESGDFTVCIHIDLFNGQVAFVQLDTIEENDVNFVTRQQMEGQSVLSIDQNYFKWRLIDEPPNYEDLELELD